MNMYMYLGNRVITKITPLPSSSLTLHGLASHLEKVDNKTPVSSCAEDTCCLFIYPHLASKQPRKRVERQTDKRINRNSTTPVGELSAVKTESNYWGINTHVSTIYMYVVFIRCEHTDTHRTTDTINPEQWKNNYLQMICSG